MVVGQSRAALFVAPGYAANFGEGLARVVRITVPLPPHAATPTELGS
jgi:hypothetical protein